MSSAIFGAALLMACTNANAGDTPPPQPEPATSAAAPGEQAAAPGRSPQDQTDIVVTGGRQVPGDPLRKINAASFAVTEAIDKNVLGPVALTVQRVVPNPVRSGLRNFLNNIHEPVVFLNFLLQHKFGKAAGTLGRFGVNSTVGGAGLFDVAKQRPFKLPRRPNGFADTMAFYGVRSGPFLFLPLVGSTTPRDLLGDVVDRLVMPMGFGSPFNRVTYTIPTGAVGALDRRAQFDDQLTKLRSGSVDAYTARREYYLASRRAEIAALHGTPRQPAVSAVETASSAAAPRAPHEDSASGTLLLVDLPAPSSVNQGAEAQAQPTKTPDLPAPQPQH